MSCSDCVFRGVFHDMGASCDVCNLQSDFLDAIKACENSADCRHRFTVDEAKKIVIEREGEPKIEKTRNERQSEEMTIEDAFARVAKAAESAMKPLLECMQKLADSWKGDIE